MGDCCSNETNNLRKNRRLRCGASGGTGLWRTCWGWHFRGVFNFGTLVGVKTNISANKPRGLQLSMRLWHSLGSLTAKKKTDQATLQQSRSIKTFLIFQHGLQESIGSKSVNLPRYSQVESAQLASLFESFRRIAMSSDLVLMSVLEELRTQWFLRFFPAAIHPQMAIVSLAGEGR